MANLDWNRLLCEERLRKSKGKVEGTNKESDVIARNAFEADYDRIVGSSSVRRLEDKAQVFPLQKNDVVRTRLTHSLEVSAMARSLGKAVGRQLEKRDIFDRAMTEKLEAMLQTAGLIHDLGNPPFGHYGESIIREWFVKEPNIKLQSEQEKKDFEYFDGNVQNLRIVTKLQVMNDVYGANFTYGTLATIIKYPADSVSRTYSKNKFGYFKSEENIVKKIWDATGLSRNIRHPATYLLEAADDIIYICDDIEDGVKKNCIDWDFTFGEIKNNEHLQKEEYQKLFKELEEKEFNENMVRREQILAKVRLFRNRVQTFLFEKAVQEFMDAYDDIVSGNYKKKELLACEEKLIGCLKDVTKEYCFANREVLILELAGKQVLKGLLDIFSEALLGNDVNEEKIRSVSLMEGKIYHLISDNYKFIAEYDYDKEQYRNFDSMSTYDKVHLIVDYISGMTDSFAVNLYKELTGISLPE